MAELKFIAGHASLDFVNTVGAWVSDGDTALRDKLTGYRTLVSWCRMAGLSSPAEERRLQHAAQLHPQHAARILARAVRLRMALYRIFQASLEGRRPPPKEVNLLTKELAGARARERLVASPGGFVWAWDDPKDALQRPLWLISKSAADLLTSSGLARLRQCGGDECGWMFLDTSRNRTRRWCDMKECGNRAKVRRFRRRNK